MSTSDSGPVASIVITTKNRVDELCRAIESALGQSLAVEIIVIDDGSTDGTSEIVRSRFPDVKVVTCEKSAGLIIRRNEGARNACGEILISIDDDAEFSTPRIIEQTLDDFNASDRIGAVAIPCIDVLKCDRVRQPFPDDRKVYVTSEYIGTAHAVRRDVFLDIGGYRDLLVHQGEERDFCVRMLDAGYVVRLGTADPIHHYESPKRDLQRMDYFGQRNNILFAWQNAPLRYLPWHLMGTTIKTLVHGCRVRRPFRVARNVAAGYLSIPRFAATRRPVCPRTWKLSRQLRRAGAMRINEVMPSMQVTRKATSQETRDGVAGGVPVHQ